MNLVALIYVVGVRMGRLELKTETMWELLVKGAMLEAHRAGVVTRGNPSPLHVRPEIARYFESFRMKLVELYRDAKAKQLSDSEIVFIFATKFADELANRVCIPTGINLGMALVVALQLCKEEETDGTVRIETPDARL